MKNTIIDNSIDELSMTKVLQDLWSDQHINEVKIATGYWDLKAVAQLYNVIKPFLDRGNTQWRILIGNDPYVYESMLNDKEKYKDCHRIGDYIKVDINELDLNKKEYVDAAKLFLDYADGDNPKVQIRLYDKDENGNKQLLHSKCYIFKGVNDSYGIIGSSNFTEKGLQDNAELNYLETDSTRVMATPKPGSNQKGHDCWFDTMWEKAEDWTKEFLVQLRKSKVGTKAAEPDVIPDNPQLNPYEVYIKFLSDHFGDIASADEKNMLISYLPKKFKPLEYQLDAVQQCFYILKNFGGFILADVVGLGKTITGVLILKKFISQSNIYNRNAKVLIITPPSLKQNWQATIDLFDVNSNEKISQKIQIVTTGSIGNYDDEFDYDDNNIAAGISTTDFGFIMIDESHNFRNSETQKYAALDTLIDKIKATTGSTPFVGLLSATPQNNSPRDLKNQIYLFQRQRQKTNFPVEGGKLDSFFSEKEKEFDTCRKALAATDKMHAQNSEQTKQHLRNQLKGISQEIRKKVLDFIVVRRTRTDLKKFYPDDSKDLKFPQVMPPVTFKYKMGTKLAQLFAETVECIAAPIENLQTDENHIGYYRYCAIAFLKDGKIYETRNRTVENISVQLAIIMQNNLIKRLESSFDAFRESLANLWQYTKNMIKMWEEDSIFICPDIDVNAVFKKCDFDFTAVQKALRAKIEQKNDNKNREFKRSDFHEEYIFKLRQDYTIIATYLNRWNIEHADPKFDAFKIRLYSILDENQNVSRKLVIFTEALATQNAIADFLNYQDLRVLKISAANRDEMQETIRRNFDANCPADEQEDNYDVIVTTEVLAEGVNLHRANAILNYDTPWNATRLMQRIGRVNRIGSPYDKVFVYNFYPSAQSDNIIDLINRSYAKLQAFHVLFGEDNKVYSELEEISADSYVSSIEGEESPFATFFADLKSFREGNPARYTFIKNIPAKDIGGQRGLPNALFAIKSSDGSTVCITTDGNNSQEIPAVKFMELLRCKKDEIFAPQPDTQKYAELEKAAKKEFSSVVNSSITSRDMTRRIKKAMDICAKIRQKISDGEPRKIVNVLDTAVRHHDINAVKIVEKAPLDAEPQALSDYIVAKGGNLNTEQMIGFDNEANIFVYEI